jgi:prephenate dehydrogenase
MSTELTIVGIGLIGGSFALATRAAFDRINVLDPDDGHVAYALERGMADARVQAVPPTTSAVLIACPSDKIAGWVEKLEAHPATVFDAGSVKAAILAEVEALIGRIPENFVPAHPIAGLERSGPEAADAGLFVDKTVILTPIDSTDAARQQEVTGYWRLAGARVIEMDAVEHDRVYARMSHLPHLLAFAYLQGIGAGDVEHAGGGFRDFSRIGGSDPDMWSAIFDRNRDAVLDALAGFETDLAAFRGAIESQDVAELKDLIARAQRHREGRP